MSFNIAIDGPAGAGKSTIARRLAEKLSFLYVDTGAMYRAVTVYLLQHGIPPEDQAAVAEACRDIHISLEYQNGEQQVLLNGVNVNGLLRTEEVGSLTSGVSAIPAVRELLLDLQKKLAAENDVIMDGRDIGTNILPGAQLKIYLTASVETRARRRYLEEMERNGEADLALIEERIAIRDYNDMHRAIAPLCQAGDAVCVDTSDLDIPQVLERLEALYRERAGL
ncbi:MAG: (d)CMP kinase [Candidatus Limivivens sp.]|nr:(d)CMP kinase [Candidatus Limivivens sp.]